MHYSKTTGGFYDASISTKGWPADTVEITSEAYEALMLAQSQGKLIQGNKDGQPEAVTPVPPRPVVPTVVNMAQARLALLAAGKLSAVNAAMADADEATRIEWEFRPTVDRNSPLVAAMAAVLNLNATKLDELFTAAGKL